jgi:hypothetical protein
MTDRPPARAATRAVLLVLAVNLIASALRNIRER